MDLPISNVKDYIVKCRQAGQPDSAILTALRSANWPEDIINMAVHAADSVFPSVPEPAQQPELEKKAQQPNAQQKTLDSEIQKTQEKKEVQQKNPKQKKKICFLAFIALLLSPIPFIGMGVAMTSLDMIMKKKMSGAVLAIAALLINIGIILFALYMIYQIFTLDSSQLTGFSKYVNDMFGLV